MAFALQAVPFLLLFGYYKLFTHAADNIHLTWLVLLFPLPLIQTCLLSLGISLWMSASTAKFRDLVHLNQYIVQIWMFATPVVYPLIESGSQCSGVGSSGSIPMSVMPGGSASHLPARARGSLRSERDRDFHSALSDPGPARRAGISLFQRVERTVIDSV